MIKSIITFLRSFLVELYLSMSYKSMTGNEDKTFKKKQLYGSSGSSVPICWVKRNSLLNLCLSSVDLWTYLLFDRFSKTSIVTESDHVVPIRHRNNHIAVENSIGSWEEFSGYYTIIYDVISLFYSI